MFADDFKRYEAVRSDASSSAETLMGEKYEAGYS